MSNQEETKKSTLKKGDSQKKPDQPRENNNRARRDVKVKGDANEEECVARPVVTRAQAKETDKVHPLKVKEAISSLQLKIFRRIRLRRSCFDCVGRLIIRENYVGEFFMKNGLLYRMHQESRTGRFTQLVIPRGASKTPCWESAAGT